MPGRIEGENFAELLKTYPVTEAVIAEKGDYVFPDNIEPGSTGVLEDFTNRQTLTAPTFREELVRCGSDYVIRISIS